MLQHVFAFLTVAAMLYHALAGCCTHHVHTHCVELKSEAVAESTKVVGGCNHHHSDGHAHHHRAIPGEIPQPHSHEHPDSTCDEQSCQFLDTAADSALPFDAPSLCDALVATPASIESLVLVAGSPARFGETPCLADSDAARLRSEVWLL